MTSEPSLDDRVVRALIRRRRFDNHALAALLRARELLALSLGLLLAKVRDTTDPVRLLMARVKELEAVVHQREEENEILRARLLRTPARRRRHFTPEQRFRILSFMRSHVLSIAETAERFLVSASTIVRWLKEVAARPERHTVGSLVKATPPVVRYADVCRRLVRDMERLGFGGNRRIAQTLARTGWALSARTVGRVRKERLPPEVPAGPQPSRKVTARFPNHLWMMDLTEIPGLFRIFSFKLAVVFDAFSRMPLAARTYLTEPSSEDMLKLLRQAVGRHGRCRHFVSDRGAQFTGQLFREALARLGIRQRFGAIGKTGSIALIERFWRTVKDEVGLRFWRPLLKRDLDRCVGATLVHYAYLRPHQGLRGGAPAEVYFGISPAQRAASRPPRGRPGQQSLHSGFEIAHLDPEHRRLAFLIERAA